MKGVLIFAALVVGCLLYALNNYGNIVAPMITHIAQQEGSVDDIQQAAQQDDPAVFSARYKPFLDQRYRLARVSRVMDDDTMAALCEDTCNRYNGTPLQTDPEFGFILFSRADLLNQRQNFGVAGDLYNEYLTLFPNGDGVSVARSALVGLRINHGYSN